MNTKLRLALGLPLVGLILTWSMFFLASYYQSNLEFGSGSSIRWQIYFYFLGIAVFAGASVFAFRLADSEVLATGSKAAKAVLKFTGFGVVLSAVTGAIYAFTVFVGSIFEDGSNKFVESYLPIILMAGVVVVSILQATVWRKSLAAPGAEKDPRKRALAMAWMIPIFGSAIALIIGLLSYSGNQDVSVWVWVVTLSIIMASVLLGTRFAAIARGLVKVELRSNTVEIGGGANRLNFVLAVVFGAVVTFVAFGTGMEAASSLVVYRYDAMGTTLSHATELTPDWLANQFIPSVIFLLLSQGIIYFSVNLRHRSAE